MGQGPFDGLIEATHSSGHQSVEGKETFCEERNGNSSLFPFEVECYLDTYRLRWVQAEGSSTERRDLCGLPQATGHEGREGGVWSGDLGSKGWFGCDEGKIVPK